MRDSQTCQSCGAAMAAGQDWCLECGTAAPGRLAQRPGWRVGALVLSLTLLLVGGASVAGYAAVTGDAERQSAAQNPAPGTPVPAQVPASPAPERPTSEPPKVVPVEPPASADTDLSSPPVTPVDDVTPLPDTSPNTTIVPDPSAPATLTPAPMKISTNDVDLYDPYERAGAEFGDPRDALSTSEPFFDVTVPADGEPVGAGLQIDLGAVRQVTEISFRTTTPGMGLEIYGVAKGQPSGLKAGWRLLDELQLPSGQRDVAVRLDADADDDGERVRRLVLWFTTPANAEDPRASVGRLKVLAVGST